MNDRDASAVPAPASAPVALERVERPAPGLARGAFAVERTPLALFVALVTLAAVAYAAARLVPASRRALARRRARRAPGVRTR